MRPLSLLLLTSLAGCGSALPSASPTSPLTLLWTAPLASTDQPIIDQGVVYLRAFHAGHPEEPSRVYAVDAAKGSELWASKIEASPSSDPLILTSDHRIVVPSEESFRVLDARTGEEVATLPNQPVVDTETGNLVTNDMKQVAAGQTARNGVFYCLDAKLRLQASKGKTVLWTQDLKLSKDTTGARFGWADGTLLVSPFPAKSVEVHAYRDGKALWKSNLKDFSDVELSAARLKGQTVIVEGKGRQVKDGADSLVSLLVGLDPTSGQEKWRYGPYGRVVAIEDGLWVTQDALMSNVGEEPAFTAQIDPETGKELKRKPWTTQGPVLEGTSWVAQTTTWPDTSSEYTGDKRGSKMQRALVPAPLFQSSLQAVSFETGKVVAQSQEWKATQIGAPPAVANGTVFVTTLAEMKEGRSGLSAYSARIAP